MIRIESEQRIDVLRQAALLLNKENGRLFDLVQKLTLEIARRDGTDEQLALEDLIKLLERREEVVAKSKPKNENENENDRSSKDPPAGHGPTEQPNLPVDEKLFPFETTPVCPNCNAEITILEGQFEISQEITLVERSFVRSVWKAAKGICFNCHEHVAVAPMPKRPKVIDGGIYSPEFAVEVAVDKYADHQPLERQVRTMAREGLNVTSQTLFDQLYALAMHLKPIYDLLCATILKVPVLHVDETGWRLWNSKVRTPWCIWGLATPDLSVYRFMSSKSKKAAREVLKDYSGIVVADGYKVYSSLARAGPFRLANCWAHVVRKFKEIQGDFPQSCDEILGLLGKLYAIERLVPGPFPGDEEAQRLRLELRRKMSKPIVEEIRKWGFSQTGLKRSRFGKTVRYMLARWDELTLFLEEPQVPLDNNRVERALRGPVVGRKNHYGSRSDRGIQVAAILYTLCETAQLQGIDPKKYLTQALHRAIANPGTITLPKDIVA